MAGVTPETVLKCEMHGPLAALGAICRGGPCLKTVWDAILAAQGQMDFAGLPSNDLKPERMEVKLSEADVQQAYLQRVPVVTSTLPVFASLTPVTILNACFADKEIEPEVTEFSVSSSKPPPTLDED